MCLLAGGRIWSRDELGRLEELYPHHTNPELTAFFPDRTSTSIQHAGSRGGWSKTPDTRARYLDAARDQRTVIGRRRNDDGYVLVLKPEHPHASKGGYVMEHRLVMEAHLGRYLLPSEVVHHQNGIKDDNRIENLEVMSPGQHTVHHNKGAKRSATTRAKIRAHSLKRFADKQNHPEYRRVDPDELKRVVTTSDSVNSICQHFGFTRRTFYNKLDELGLREWYYVEFRSADWAAR